MATVRFFLDEQDLLPDVCIKTGVPTPEVVTLRATYRPAWPVLFLPFSLLASVVGLVAGARHATVNLPMKGDVVTRFRSWWRWSFTAVAAGSCGMPLAAVLHEATLGIVMLVTFLSGIATNIGARLIFWCGVSLDKACEVVTVRRCHLNFVDAMKERSRL